MSGPANPGSMTLEQAQKEYGAKITPDVHAAMVEDFKASQLPEEKPEAKHPADMTPEEFKAAYPDAKEGAFERYHARLEEERLDQGHRELSEAMAGISAKPLHDLLKAKPISEKAIRKLGLASEFGLGKGDRRYKGITTKDAKGIQVDGNEGAVGAAIQAGPIPEGSTPNDLANMLDDEDRKGETDGNIQPFDL